MDQHACREGCQALCRRQPPGLGRDHMLHSTEETHADERGYNVVDLLLEGDHPALVPATTVAVMRASWQATVAVHPLQEARACVVEAFTTTS